MGKKKGDEPDMVVSTIRLEKEKLRELQYYLSLQDVTFVGFVNTKVDEFLQAFRQQHPERVPGGMPVKS